MLGPLVGLCALLAGSPAASPGPQYHIEVRVEPESRELRGLSRVRFTNRTEHPAEDLCLHLYQNAFRDRRSTFWRGLEREGVAPAWSEATKGFIELEALSAGAVDLRPTARFIAPDDGNLDDRTVLLVPLPTPLGPGEVIELSLGFTTRLPRPVARSGATRDFVMASQWFPKLGVLEPEPGAARARMRCHQYHALGEFRAEFGRYEVVIDAPRSFAVGATGVRLSEAAGEGERVRYRYEQDGVHDFAFALDRWAQPIERRFVGREQIAPERLRSAATYLGVPEETLLPGEVRVRLVIRPERGFAAERYFQAAFHALREYGLRFGPYPYPTLTLVDPPPDARETGGMEYPTLITGGARLLAPASMPVPETVTLHEIGHQYFYGLLASDEVNEAWLDEGLTSYATLRTYEAAYGETLRYAPSVLGVPLTPWFAHPLRFRDVERARFLASPSMDPSLQASWRFRDLSSYRSGVYARPVLFFLRLERLLGLQGLDRALYRYVQRHRLGAPTTQDLLAALAEAHGGPLQAWATEPLYRPGALDLRIARFRSRPETADPEGRFHTEVVVERRGELTRPTELVLSLEGGEQLRFPISGAERWWRFEHLGARARRAELFGAENDPLNQSEIDRGWRIEPEARPGVVFAGHAAALLAALIDLLGVLL